MNMNNYFYTKKNPSAIIIPKYNKLNNNKIKGNTASKLLILLFFEGVVF